MKSTNLEDKLVRVERTINVYKLNNDLVEGINIDNAPLNTLISIVPPKEGDPWLYDGYVLSPEQLEAINSFVNGRMPIGIKGLVLCDFRQLISIHIAN